jgi:hypothetical protein
MIKYNKNNGIRKNKFKIVTEHRFSALQIITETFCRQYTKQIIVQIGRCVSKCKFNVSEGQNIHPRNKRIFYIKIFSRTTLNFLGLLNSVFISERSALNTLTPK